MRRKRTRKLSERVRHKGRSFTVTTYGPITSDASDFNIKGSGVEALSKAEKISIAEKAVLAMKKKEIEKELAKKIKDIDLTIKL